MGFQLLLDLLWRAEARTLTEAVCVACGLYGVGAIQSDSFLILLQLQILFK